MRRRAAALLVLVAAVWGCKRDAPAVAPSPSPAPAAATPLPAAIALSYFEPGDAGCAWIRHDAATGTRTTLATVPGDCEGARVAWSADRTRALLWTESVDPPAISLFESGPGGTVPRPAVPLGTLRDAGWDASGALLALTLEEIPPAQAKQGFAAADGVKLPVPRVMDGLPVLARAFRFEAGAWKRIETKVSDDAWDLALGVAALDAEKTLGARSWKLLSHMPDGREAKPDEAKALDAGCTRTAADGGSWFQPLGSGVFVRLEDSEFVIALPPVCVLDPKKGAAALPLDLDAEDSLAVQLAGDWLLISDSRGRRPHLLGARRETAWSSKTAVEAVFWP